MEMTAHQLATRYLGVHEFDGAVDHPLIKWWLSLCGFPLLDIHDEVAWCAAFVYGIAWELDLPRPAQLAGLARSWLKVGTHVDPADVRIGFDVAVLSRGADPKQGHVGFVSGFSADPALPLPVLLLLGGNQGNRVSIAAFPVARVIEYRRLLPA